jgi:glucose-1-phosphate adenylyltransferase
VNRDLYALILAGGVGSRLSILSQKRAKPAVPFGGKYRIIDFTLSNCVNSGIDDIGILTQYRPMSLNEHIGSGKAWDLDRQEGGITLLQPFLGRQTGDWYLGTADAVYQNLDQVTRRKVDNVLVLSGDHVYKMDYNRMVRFHQEKGADVTIAVTSVPWETTNQFGIVEVDEEGRIIDFQEKPEKARSNLVSMGVYVWNARALVERLTADAARHDSSHDFGKSIIPAMIPSGKALAYRFDSYWQDIGTLDAYYDANLDLVNERPRLDLFDAEWKIHTPSAERPPVKFGPGGSGVGSLIANGCIVLGRVERSVLFPGVFVGPGARLTNSIVMNDTRIESGAQVDRTILDKNISVGEGAVIGRGETDVPNRLSPSLLYSGLIVVGKSAQIPAGTRVGRNSCIASDVTAADFPEAELPAGSTIGAVAAP